MDGRFWLKIQGTNLNGKNQRTPSNDHCRETRQKTIQRIKIANKSKEVTLFLDEQNHPFRKEIKQFRNCILSASTSLTENIRWNGPNYCFDNADRFTMRIQPPTKKVQLIFHREAGKQTQPKDKLISNKNKMLVWKEKWLSHRNFHKFEWHRKWENYNTSSMNSSKTTPSLKQIVDESINMVYIYFG